MTGKLFAREEYSVLASSLYAARVREGQCPRLVESKHQKRQMKFVETLEGIGKLTSLSGSCAASYRVDFWFGADHEISAMGNITADVGQLACRVGEQATLELMDGRTLEIAFLAISPEGVLFISAGADDDERI